MFVTSYMHAGCNVNFILSRIRDVLKMSTPRGRGKQARKAKHPPELKSFDFSLEEGKDDSHDTVDYSSASGRHSGELILLQV